MIKQIKRQVEEICYEEEIICHRCDVRAPLMAPTKGKDSTLFLLEYGLPREAWVAGANKKGWGNAYVCTSETSGRAQQMHWFCPGCYPVVSAFIELKAVPSKPASPPPKAEARPARPMPNPYSRFEVDE